MLIDTHAHLNFNAYKDDVDEVIKRSLDNNIWMINVGSQYETSRKAVEMAEKYPVGVYAAVGLHPIHLSNGIFKTKIDTEEIEFNTKEEEFSYEDYKKLAQSKKVVAIGETGFDYYYRPKTKIKLEQGDEDKSSSSPFAIAREFKERQKEVFLKQLDLARELNFPVIFHCRMAHNDLIEVLNHNQRLTGVVHCFTGNWQQAEKYLAMGLYLGFNGIIFKLNLDEIIKKTPLERILIETDCPYLTPSPENGRNEPIYVKQVAERIAKIKEITFSEIMKITNENATKLFKFRNLPD